MIEVAGDTPQDRVKSVTMEWAVSKLREPADLADWTEMLVTHGKMVALERAEPITVSGTPTRTGVVYGLPLRSPFEHLNERVAILHLLDDINSCHARLLTLYRHTHSPNFERKRTLSDIWTERQLRTLTACVTTIIKVSWVNIALGNGLSVEGKLGSCKLILHGIAEYLPAPDKETAEILLASRPGTIAVCFPWLERDILEALI